MPEIFDSRRYLIPFRSSLLPQIFTDTLVIGGGVAGLRAAIGAAAHGDVIVLVKDDLSTSNSAWAQGGVAAVLTSEDTVESHVRDTLEAGAGLCDRGAVELVVRRGPEMLRELIGWGLNLDRGEDGTISMGREGGHSHRRIVHSDGDATGRELVRCLHAQVTRTAGVRVFERCFALDIITAGSEPGAPAMGAITHHPRHGLQMIWAKATVVASGGAGMVYRETTNPRSATGDGLAMAYRAGATMADMAFVQFHPTTLYLAGASRSLITEAIRGQGAHLVDASGHRFMLDEHPLAELAPRDVVTRAIVRRLSSHGGTNVFLDVRHVEQFVERFPGIAQLLKRFDLDPSNDLIPVNPAAHYTIGGVRTDLCGRSDVPGLYAVGEASCSGVHGANRLASNSLLEGLVMGAIAGEAAREMTQGASRGGSNGATAGAANGGSLVAAPAGWGTGARAAPIPIVSDIRPSEQGELDLTDVQSSLRSAMWRNAGVERSGPRLRDVIEMIRFWGRYTLDKIFDAPEGWQVQNMLLVAWLVARSAEWRTESRGCHWRTDGVESMGANGVSGGSGSGRAAGAAGPGLHDAWRRGREGPLTEGVREVEIGA